MSTEKTLGKTITRDALVSLVLYALPVIGMLVYLQWTGQHPWQHTGAANHLPFRLPGFLETIFRNLGTWGLPLIILIVGIIEFAYGLYDSRWNNNEKTLDIISFVVPKIIIRPTVTYFSLKLLPLLAPGAKDVFNWVPFWWAFLIIAVADDLTQYWYHRLHHQVPFLWRFHWTHHSAPYMGMAMASRQNIIYTIFFSQIYLTAILTYLGLGYAALFVTGVKSLITTAAHSSIKWDKPFYTYKALKPIGWVMERLISTPATHHAHHADSTDDGIGYYKGNFGNMFFIWDLIFGTGIITRQYPAAYGIKHYQQEEWYAQFFWPLFKSRKAGSELSADGPEVFDENPPVKPVAVRPDKKGSLTATTLLVMATLLSAANGQAQSKPNVIVIYADDLGWNQLSAYGNRKIQTPNIDAIGKQGVRFTQAYATAPICSPSRMGLLTGRYQQRFGAEFLVPEEKHTVLKDQDLIDKIKADAIARKAVNEPVDTTGYKAIPKGIPLTETLIGQYFKDAGYATAAIGKWHAGEVDGLKPWQRGFDYYYGTLTWGSIYTPVNTPGILTKSYYFHTNLSRATSRDGSIAIVKGDASGQSTVVEESAYLTDRIGEEAISFIDQHKKDPFFLYVPFTAVHDPFQAKQADFDRVKGVTDSTERIYLAMLLSLDDAVGKILAKLKADGLENNTLVFFGSDNGGASYTGQMTNAPLKAGKLSHFEGGIRVPLLAKFPGKIARGQEYDLPVSNLDIFGTAVAAAGIALPANKTFDGVNLLDYINGKNKKAPHAQLFWRNGYSKAVRDGNWKLYVNDRSGKILLYNISKDPGEQNDLSASQPALVDKLRKALTQWESQLAKPAWPSLRAELIPELAGTGNYFPI